MNEFIAIANAKDSDFSEFKKAIKALIASAEAIGYNKGYNEARKQLGEVLINKGLLNIMNKENGK